MCRLLRVVWRSSTWCNACCRLFGTESTTRSRVVSDKLLDGRATSRVILEEIRARTAALWSSAGIRPGLAVVQVGARPDASRYVELKRLTALRVGFGSEVAELGEDCVEGDVLRVIDEFNARHDIHGILVQLPLPKRLSQAVILNRILIYKDVDGFHPYNVGSLALKRMGSFEPWATGDDSPWASREAETCDKSSQSDRVTRAGDCMVGIGPATNVACTPRACLELLDRYEVPILGKHVVVLGRSNVVGMPMTLMFMNRGATVTNVCSDMPIDISIKMTRLADVVVCAIGSPHMITREWIKPGAVVVDVGINFVRDSITGVSRVIGDVDTDDVAQVASKITPVPGGVGPMTIAMLLQNTLYNAQQSVVDSRDRHIDCVSPTTSVVLEHSSGQGSPVRIQQQSLPSFYFNKGHSKSSPPPE